MFRLFLWSPFVSCVKLSWNANKDPPVIIYLLIPFPKHETAAEQTAGCTIVWRWLCVIITASYNWKQESSY